MQYWSSIQRQKLRILREQIARKERIQLLLQCNIMVETNASSEGGPVKVISPDMKLDSLHHPLAPTATSLVAAGSEDKTATFMVHHIVTECVKLVALKTKISVDHLLNLLPNEILSTIPKEFFTTYIKVLNAVDQALKSIRLVWEDKALFARRVQNALVEAETAVTSKHPQNDMARLRHPHIKVEESALPLGDILGESMQTQAISVLDVLSKPQQTKTIFKLAPLQQESFCPKHFIIPLLESDLMYECKTQVPQPGYSIEPDLYSHNKIDVQDQSTSTNMA